MISKERLLEMRSAFWNETNEPESEEWRDELTEEEAFVVAEWDEDFETKYAQMRHDLAAREARL